MSEEHDRLTLYSFSFLCDGALPGSHSFPTRRSSDLFAASERSSCRRSRYSGVTSPVTYSPEKHEVSNSWMRASSCLHADARSEEHTSELQSPDQIVCRLLLVKKKLHREVGRN